MNKEGYTSGCKFLGWTAIAIVSIFVILSFVFMIIGFVLGLLMIGDDSSQGKKLSGGITKRTPTPSS